MEKSAAKRHIAIVEKCMMSAMGLKHLFASPSLNAYEVHLFNNIASFQSTLNSVPYSTLIYSLSPMSVKSDEIVCCASRS